MPTTVNPTVLVEGGWIGLEIAPDRGDCQDWVLKSVSSRVFHRRTLSSPVVKKWKRLPVAPSETIATGEAFSPAQQYRFPSLPKLLVARGQPNMPVSRVHKDRQRPGGYRSDSRAPDERFHALRSGHQCKSTPRSTVERRDIDVVSTAHREVEVIIGR